MLVIITDVNIITRSHEVSYTDCELTKLRVFTSYVAYVPSRLKCISAFPPYAPYASFVSCLRTLFCALSNAIKSPMIGYFKTF